MTLILKSGGLTVVVGVAVSVGMAGATVISGAGITGAVRWTAAALATLALEAGTWAQSNLKIRSDGRSKCENCTKKVKTPRL